MTKLAVASILTEAIRTVWTERSDFARIAVIPAVALAFTVIGLQVYQLSAILDRGMTLPERPSIADAHEMATRLLDENGGFFVIALIFMFLAFVIVCFFACAWHYRVLRPAQGRTVREALRWDPAKGRFILMAILLGAIQIAVQFGTSLVSGFVGVTILGAAPGLAYAIVPILLVVPYGVAIYVMLRFAMVLPAAAVGDNLTLQDSWRLTKGNGLALMGLALLILFGLMVAMVTIFIPISVIFSLLAFISPGLLTMMLLMQLLLCSQFILGAGVWVTALSLTYRQLGNPASGQS